MDAPPRVRMGKSLEVFNAERSENFRPLERDRRITSLFLAAAIGFLLPPVVPVAARLYQLAAVGAEQANTVAWASGSALLTVRSSEDPGLASMAGNLARSTLPFRAELILDAANPGASRFLGNDAMARRLGPVCLPGAMEPLVRKEAEQGDRAYLTRISADFLEAADETERFGRPLLDPWWATFVGVGLLLLAWLSGKLLSKSYPTYAYVVPSGMSQRQRELENVLPDVEGSLARAVQRKTDLLANVVDDPASKLRRKLNPFAKEDGTTALQREVQLATVRVVELERELETATENLSLHRASMAKHQAGALEHAEMRARVRRFGRKTILAAAMGSLCVGTAYAVATFAGFTTASLSTRGDVAVLRSDTLLASALRANPELVASVAKECGVAQVDEAMETSTTAFETATADSRDAGSVASALEGYQPPETYWTSIVNVFLIVGGNPAPVPRHGATCKIGKPCGGACIPVDHMCRVSQATPRGSCGTGFVPDGKICRVAPKIVPVSATQSAAPPFTMPHLDFSSSPTTPPVTAQPSPSSSSSSGWFGTSSAPSPAPSPRPTGSPSPTVAVHGYTRSNGTVIEPYTRSAPGQGTARTHK